MSYDLILRQALKLHDEGRLDEAERLYRQILETAPDHPVVLNLLGLVAQSKGLHEQAVSFFAAYFGVYYFLLFLLDGCLSKQEVADSNALSSYLIGYSILITSIFGLIAAIHPLLVGVLILSLFGAMVFVVGLNQLLNVSNQKKIVLALSFSFLLLTLPPALYQLLARISTL